MAIQLNLGSFSGSCSCLHSFSLKHGHSVSLCLKCLQVGAADYIAVAHNYHTVFITDIPVMSMRIRDKVHFATFLILAGGGGALETEISLN